MANDNKAWYEDIIRKGTLRSSGMNEITENNPLDWTRLRVLEDGKLIPAMANGHIGAPSVLDLDLLRDAAEKGNLFLYRMGEEYPQRLVDGVWYSTDPAVAEEKRPELKLPEAPKEPASFTATLEDELRERHFDPDTRRDDLQDDETGIGIVLFAFGFRGEEGAVLLTVDLQGHNIFKGLDIAFFIGQFHKNRAVFFAHGKPPVVFVIGILTAFPAKCKRGRDGIKTRIGAEIV